MVRARLQALNGHLFPDLRRLASRLQTLSEHAAVLGNIAARSPLYERFVEFLRSLLSEPTQTALVYKKAFESDARNQKTAPGHDLKTAQRSLRLLRKRAPEVYDLEREWFDHVLGLKRHIKLSAEIKGRWWWLLVPWIIFQIVRAIVRQIGD